MYNKEIKVLLALAILSGSIYLFTEGEIGYGIVVLLLMGLVILSIFRDERILKAFYHLRKNDMQKAEATLSKIKHPEKLIKSQEAYFYYLNGLVLSQTQMNKAEKFFKRALSIGLRNDTDKAVAKLNLAGLAMSRRRKREATTLLTEVKKLDKHNMLEDQVKMMKQQLKRI
jgi:tetratricopeptide (TPR) repeat protein